MPLLTNKKATARTPQIVTLIVDDSDSMRGFADGGKSKAQVATESIQDMVITTQANTQGSRGFRFLLNIAKFGDGVTPIAEAQPPGEVNLDQLVFRGDSGWTNMAAALEWGATALEQALAKCRGTPAYDESNAPPPLVIFLSDGENTGPELGEAASRLRGVAFQDGKISVIACGIGMKGEHFAVMKGLASSEEMAVNIKPSRLAEFIAAVGATMQHPDKDHLTPFQDEWDAQMAVGRAALQAGRFAEAEAALLAALDKVRDAADGRLASTLSSLGTLHASQGNWEKAAPFVTGALDLLSRLGPSTALSEGLESAERLAELLTLVEKQPDADALWMRIAGIWNGPAAKLPARAGGLAALGFLHKAEGHTNEAEQAFEQAAQTGGVGAVAALRGLHAMQLDNREDAEPFLERLLDEVDRRFGPRHPLTAGVVGELRGSYVLGGKKALIAQLDKKYR
jgi:tetratricopeptide (TPR) repeat protein